MKTWNRSLLRIGGGLDTYKVAHYLHNQSQGSISRSDLGPFVLSAPSSPKDSAQPFKAHVFLQWKVHVSKRLQAKQSLREEFRDLRAGIRDLTVRNQENRLRIARKRLFWAWRRLTRGKGTTQPLPVFVRKYISLWRQLSSLSQARRTLVQAKRSVLRSRLLRSVFQTWKQRPFALRRALRTLQKCTALSRIRSSFLRLKRGLQWIDVFRAVGRRNEGRRQREGQHTVMERWKDWVWAKKTVSRQIGLLLKRKRRLLLCISLHHWTQTSANAAKALKIIRKYSQKARKSSFSRFFTRLLERTATDFRTQLSILPHQLESDFAAALETRIRAMKSDFEAERQEHLAQRAALLQRQQALRQTFSRHADRIYRSLSRDSED